MLSVIFYSEPQLPTSRLPIFLSLCDCRRYYQLSLMRRLTLRSIIQSKFITQGRRLNDFPGLSLHYEARLKMSCQSDTPNTHLPRTESTSIYWRNHKLRVAATRHRRRRRCRACSAPPQSAKTKLMGGLQPTDGGQFDKLKYRSDDARSAASGFNRHQQRYSLPHRIRVTPFSFRPPPSLLG